MFGFMSTLLQQGLTNTFYLIRGKSLLSMHERPFGHSLGTESISNSFLLMDPDMVEREYLSSLTHLVIYKQTQMLSWILLLQSFMPLF